MSPTASPALDHTVGDVIVIDDRTVLVLGQELDMAARQPDIANVLLHRVDRTLFMIDTGVTATFRQALTVAVDRVGPWDHLVVLITHGHPDHVGNNDLADQLAQERGIDAQVWMPAGDVDQMRDPQTYWKTSLDRLPGLAPLPAAPGLAALKISSVFQPYRPFSQHTRTYEQDPAQAITIGARRFVGWIFADGAVAVIPSQGHSTGHVVVYLRDAHLLHMGDETNGPCPIGHDADQHKLTEIQSAALSLIQSGAVTQLTDGHTFAVHDAHGATRRLTDLLQQSLILQGEAARLTNGHRSVETSHFADGIATCYRDLAVQGANANPVFLGMIAAGQLQRLGYTHQGSGTTWRASPLTPRTSPARTAARAAAGAAATLPWVLRGRRKLPSPASSAADRADQNTPSTYTPEGHN